MRLSVRADDPGNILYASMGYLGRKVRVKLDGEEISAVITADEEEGFVVRYRKDVDDHFVIEDDEAVTETITGKVEIILPAGYRN